MSIRRIFVFLLLLQPAIVFADAVTDYNLAVQFYKQKRWKLAAEACDDFIKKYPEHNQVSMAHLYWGQSLVHLRDFKNARGHFRAYLDDPKAVSDRALAMYRVGESSYFLNDAQSAEKELTEFLKEHVDHELAEWAVVYLAHAQFQLNKTDAAIRSFKSALEKFNNGPLRGEAEYGLARAFEVNQQTDRALALYAKIAGEDQNTHAADAEFHRAAIYFSQGDFKTADEGFRVLTSRFPSHQLVPLAHLNAGYAMYQLKQFPEAVQRFEQAEKDPSQKLTATFWKGLSYKSMGDYEQASKIFRQSLADYPEQPLAESLTFQRGDAEFRLGNYSETLDLFEDVYTRWQQGRYADDALHSACEAAFQAGNLTKAAELNALFQKSYQTSGLAQVQELLYGRILIAMGDQADMQGVEKQAFFRKAVDVLQEVAEQSTIEQTAQHARFHLARSFERLGEDDRLVASLTEDIQSTDESDIVLESRLLVANAKLRQKKYGEAIQLYERSLPKLGSKELQRAGYVGLISSHIANKNWDNIQAELAELASLGSTNQQYGQLALAAGDAAFDDENWKVAEAFFRMGAEQADDNPYYLASLSGLGHAHFKQDQFEPAATAFAKLTKTDKPRSALAAHAWYMLGTSQLKNGNEPAALKAYQDGLRQFEELPQKADAETLQTVYSMAKAASRVARDQGERKTAEGLYEVAMERLRALPESAQVEMDKLLYEWADMHYNAEDYTRADELFAMLIRETPKSTLADDAGLILAESTRFAGKNDEAEKQFRALIANPDSDEFVKQRASIHLVDIGAERKDWQSVLKDAQALQAINPENEHRLYLEYRISEALVQTRKFSEASQKLVALKNEISEDLTNAPEWWEEVWLLQAECLLALKKYDELQEVMENLRQVSPNSKVIHRGDLLLGRSFEQQAEFDKAREAYTRVIDSKFGQGTESAAESQFRIAESFLKQNNYEQALKEYYKVYAGYDFPAYEAAALYQAARSDISRKDWSGAVGSFRILVEEFAESEYAPDARKQLAEIEKAFPELKRESP